MKIKPSLTAVYLLKMLRLCCLIFPTLWGTKESFGQAPTVSYASPQTYTVGNTITPLVPASTGVATPGYTVPVAAGSGFNQPFGVAIDGFGNIYVADAGNNVIKKIPVGGGTPVSLGSGFSNPLGVAFRAGQLYIADYGNNAIKQMPITGGTPVTLATGFSSPDGIAVDGAGNVYVSDMGDNTVKKIPAAGGAVVTLGTGFNLPAGLTVDAFGNVYVADSGNNQVQMIPAAGGNRITIGRGFIDPLGVAVDASGNVYVADSGNNHVKKVYATGGTPVVVGSNFTPYGIIVDNVGNIYTVDHGNALVKEIKPTGGYYIHPALPDGLLMSNSTGTISGTPTTAIAATTFTVTAYNSTGSTTTTMSITVNGPVSVSYSSPQVYTVGVAISPLTPTGSSAAAQAYSNSPTALGSGFSQPYGVALDAAGNIYMADGGNSAVKKIPTGGGTPVAIGSGFNFPTGVAVDAAGNVYVADRNNNAVKEIPVGGGAPVILGSGFAFPTGVAVDPTGNVFVADAGNNAIKEIPVNGGAIITLGSGFSGPTGVAVDAADNVYVADKGNNAVKKIPAGNGAVVTLGSGFINPFGVSLDNGGNVFVADQGNNAVKEIPAGGGVTFVVGSGFGASYSPYGVTTDGAGNVYIVDFGDNAIEKVKPVGGYYVSPALPAGLVLNNSTGAISGRPGNVLPATNFTITAYNSTSDATANLNIKVNALNISYSGPQSYVVGTAITPLTPATFGVAEPKYASPIIIADYLGRPYAVAVDQAGNVYEAEFRGDMVKTILPDGSVVLITDLTAAAGVAVGPPGILFVSRSESYVGRVPITGGIPSLVTNIGATGIATDLFGNLFIAAHGNVYEIKAGDSTATNVTPTNYNIVELAVNGSGSVYGTSGGGTVLKIPFDGSPYTTIGSGFASPSGITVDGAGNVYIASSTGNKVTKIPANGGSPVVIASALNSPHGIAVSNIGNLYVTNLNIGNIQEFKPVGGYFISPALPPGLNFNDATGTISGTPTTVSPATTYTITAYNSTGSGFATVNIGVTLPPPPTISYSGPQTYTAGTTITPLAPTSSGVAAKAYSTVPITIASGFNQPGALAVDNMDDIFVSDVSNNAVKEIMSGTNTVTTVVSGFRPGGISLDKTGNIYVADGGNKAVKKIPFGSSTPVTLASGWSFPEDVTLDASGNIYVADAGAHYIEELPAGSNAQAPLTAVFSPTNVVVDNTGNIYFNNITNNQSPASLIQIPSSRGGITTTLLTNLKVPGQLAVDPEGNLYIPDSGNGVVKLLAPGSTTPTTLGITPGQNFTSPIAVALDNGGNIYVADNVTNTIKEVKLIGGYYISPALPVGLSFDVNTGTISGNPVAASAATNYTITAYNSAGSTKTNISISINNPALPAIAYASPKSYVAGGAITPLVPTKSGVSAPGYSRTPLTLDAGFYGHSAVTVDVSGNVFVADYNNNLVKKIPAGGGAPVTVASGFNHPSGIAVDASGNIYVADYSNNMVKKIPSGGGSTLTIGSGFFLPWGVAVDALGNVYVGDSGDNAVKKIPFDGSAPVTLGSGFSQPTGVAVDPAGDVYVADAGNNAIKEIPANGGAVITLGSGFSVPTGVAVDQSGNVYVADEPNNALKMIPAAGGVPVIIGTGYVLPASVAIDGANAVYTTDGSSGRVQKLNPSGGFYISPVLPAGLSINTTTGSISGTPVAASPATNYTLTAYNVAGGTPAVANITVTTSPNNAGHAKLTVSSGTLSPAFVSSTISYKDTVSNTTPSITIAPATIDPAATIKVNGTTVASGSASAAIPVKVGNNTITVVVTAADGATTKTYSLSVTRLVSSNAFLTNLTDNDGPISPVFASRTYNYTQTVAATVNMITITPTPATSTATITIYGQPYVPGTMPPGFSLQFGVNTIPIIVTAADGTTQNTYNLTVTREYSTDANLSNLTTNKGPLVPPFDPATTNYTISVSNAVLSIAFTPTSEDPNAGQILVQGKVVASGTPSGPNGLQVGNTTIKILARAQDGTTTKTYTVVVTRAAAGRNIFYQAVSVERPLNESQILKDGILVHHGLSPNGDGINDFLMIDGITNYPDNKLQIMNRSGQLVFEAKNYDNSGKVFDGHSSKTGAMQLPGTYFYVLDYVVNGVAKHKTGFIVLKY